MSPRPILKRSQSTEQHNHYPPQHYQSQHQFQMHHQHHQPQHHHHGVHFPPSPALTRTFSAYSASAYDRSPIVVTPNSCALPERGCPGRTYLLDEDGSPSPSPRGITYARDYHPRALAFASASNPSSSAATYGPVPQLIPDLSSESDESDGFSSLASSSYHHGYAHAHGAKSHTHTNHNSSIHTGSMNGYTNAYTPCDDTHDDDDDGAHLRFKAYVASCHPPAPASHFPPIVEEDDDAQPAHTSRRRRERRHESSRDPDRIRNGAETTLGFASLSISASPPSPSATSFSPSSSSPTTPSRRKKGVARHYQQEQMVLPPSSALTGGFGVPDDGCLGGF
ncbi:hypothetical protein BDZ97DRAFT_1756243 [Flammula alnicola]|nr:hypothetical protein BDZ97DRAFT_1756243 [Flammula alnicola]